MSKTTGRKTDRQTEPCAIDKTLSKYDRLKSTRAGQSLFIL